MKKYVTLLAFTLTAVGIIAGIGIAAKKSVVSVSAVKLSTLTVENSVSCTGRVERIDMTTVCAPESARIKTVYVKMGETVKAGDPLLSVQTAAPRTNASSSVPPGIPDAYKSLIDQYSSGLQSSSSSASSSEMVEQNIVAPASGLITSLPVSNLSYVSAGSPVAIIADDSGLQVRLSVNESQISDIKVGQKAILTGVGFKNSTYTGKVKSISQDAKQVTDTTGQETVVEVIVSVDKPGEDIKPGYTAKAKIITSQDNGVLIAPYEAVRADNNGSEYVYRVSGNVAVKTPITTKNEFDSGFEVIKGLSNHDVVIRNPDNVTNGSRVTFSEGGEASSNG